MKPKAGLKAKPKPKARYRWYSEVDTASYYVLTIEVKGHSSDTDLYMIIDNSHWNIRQLLDIGKSYAMPSYLLTEEIQKGTMVLCMDPNDILKEILCLK